MADRRFDYCKYYSIFAALWCVSAIACISTTRYKKREHRVDERSQVSQCADKAIKEYRSGLRQAAQELQSKSFPDWPSAFKAWADAAAQVRLKATQELDAAVNERIDQAEYSDALFHNLLKEIQEGL